MRLAAITDIHGNLPALEAVLADIDRRGVDITVNLGDILSGPLWPAETADLLINLDLPAIRGNHERQLLTLPPERMGASDRHAHGALTDRHRAWIASLPATLWLSDDVFLCHGTPGDDLVYLMETVTERGRAQAPVALVEERVAGIKAGLILCGHSHMPRVMRLENGRLIVNAGSVGLQAYADDQPFRHTVETGSPHARYALCRYAGGRWEAEIIEVPYDWTVAAALAESRGRPEWARALSTGRI